MKFTLDSLFNIDRRVVFVFVFLSLLIPLLVPHAFPCKPSRDVEVMFNLFEQAAEHHKTVFLSFEFDPTGAAEQEPMARAILRHLFARGGKAVVICKSGGQLGQALHLQILDDCAQEYGASYGEDYVYLSYLPGSTNLVINMGQSLQSTWPKDYLGKNLSEIPLTRNITRLADFEYVMIICSSLTTVDDWLTYGQAPYNLRMGFGVLGNVTPDCSNYVNTGQIKGLLGGLIGAAQYEQILMNKGIGLPRRFSSNDLVRSGLPRLCAKLAGPNRSPPAQFLWDKLSEEEREAVKKTADNKHDNLTQDQKKAISVALNDVISTNDVIADDDLKDLRIDRRVSDLLGSEEFAARRPQILRRLFVESLFPGELFKSYGEGPAMRWMTPQSIAHVVLIVAILFGNVCYFWERSRRARQARAGK